ncbi:MAG: class I SAM-dependent methyltransferase [Deltaproteobacteria bacterium]|nr:class I SAM-dependent methyltransferase [Deltaproteobacteria bacterium]
MKLKLKRKLKRSGAARIWLYNWPLFVTTWILAGCLIGTWVYLLDAALKVSLLGFLMVAGAILAWIWSAVALLVSYYVYDRSPLSRGTWVRDLLDDMNPSETWILIHAGLDSEVELSNAMPSPPRAILDIYDKAYMSHRSIARARHLAEPTATNRVPTPTALDVDRANSSSSIRVACSPISLPPENGTCDVAIVAFTAHEISPAGARAVFFAEVHRLLRPGGRMILVEHVRDLANFIAYGPGFTHFLPRSEWMRLADKIGFAVHQELRVTPWVMALALEKAKDISS